MKNFSPQGIQEILSTRVLADCRASPVGGLGFASCMEHDKTRNADPASAIRMIPGPGMAVMWFKNTLYNQI
jgi:hypothetical protein